MPIYVVDYPICWGYIQYYVNIVESVSDLPGGGVEGGDQPTSKVVNGIIKAKE